MTNMIPTRFIDATAFCIGTGPSLSGQQIQLIRTARDNHNAAVFGINDAYRVCDFLDVLYAADYRWVEHHLEQTVGLPCDRWMAFHKNKEPLPGWHEIPVIGNVGRPRGITAWPTWWLSGNQSGVSHGLHDHRFGRLRRTPRR